MSQILQNSSFMQVMYHNRKKITFTWRNLVANVLALYSSQVESDKAAGASAISYQSQWRWRMRVGTSLTLMSPSISETGAPNSLNFPRIQHSDVIGPQNMKEIHCELRSSAKYKTSYQKSNISILLHEATCPFVPGKPFPSME